MYVYPPDDVVEPPDESEDPPVEPGAYGVAVPLAAAAGVPAACVNLITYREDVAASAAPALVRAARRISAALA